MDETKVLNALHRIEDLYYQTDGKCYVSFSGGKDSTVLLQLIKMCIDSYTIKPIKAVFQNTGVEMGCTIDFVKECQKEWYSEIEIKTPSVPFAKVLSVHGKPVASKMKSTLLNRWYRGNRGAQLQSLLIDGKSLSTGRMSSKSKLPAKYFHMLHDDFTIKASNKCCHYLKKLPFKEYKEQNELKGNLLALRISEGGAREINAKARVSRGDGNICTKLYDGTIYKYPIIDWTDEDVEQFIKEYNVPLSKAYTDYGFERTGCMACPYSQTLTHDLYYLYKHEQNRYKASLFFLKDVYIAQDVELPFDEEYEHERREMWENHYTQMRNEMLEKYRPSSKLIKKYEQQSLF